MFGRNETRSAGGDYLPAQIGLFGPSGYNDTGVQITESNALICSAVWSCVSIISQTISTLPVHVVRRNGGEKQYEHPLYKLLATQPNEFMTPSAFKEAFLNNALLYGGAWAVVERDESGSVAAFYPLKSGDVTPTRRAGVLLFEVRIGSKLFTFTQDQVVNLLGWTMDGVTPISPVRSGAQALGLSVAMERYAGKAFSGGNIGGILQTPPMSKEAMTDFITSWREKYTGVDNAFKVAVLPDPMKFIPTTMKPQEGQLVEARQAIVLDVCRIWKVPPSMLGVMDKASYASLEQQNMSFFQQTILPWLVKLEQAFSLVGFLERERPELELKFNADALLRTTTAERYSAYMQGRQGGWLSINDVRRKEGLPPVENGDALLTPLNMTPVNGPAASASRGLLESTVKRFVTKEAKAIQRAAKKYEGQPAELRAWAATFYRDHETLVADALVPVLKAAGLTVDARSAASRHCSAGATRIGSAIDQKLSADELVADVEDRAAELVDELTTGKEPYATAQ